MSLCDRCNYNVSDDCVRDKMAYPNAQNCGAYAVRQGMAIIPAYQPPQVFWEVFNNDTPSKCVFIADFTG